MGEKCGISHKIHISLLWLYSPSLLTKKPILPVFLFHFPTIVLLISSHWTVTLLVKGYGLSWTTNVPSGVNFLYSLIPMSWAFYHLAGKSPVFTWFSVIKKLSQIFSLEKGELYITQTQMPAYQDLLYHTCQGIQHSGSAGPEGG